jgi:hypothetical protein
MANDSFTLEQSATKYLGTLTDAERKSLAAFLACKPPGLVCSFARPPPRPFERIAWSRSGVRDFNHNKALFFRKRTASVTPKQLGSRVLSFNSRARAHCQTGFMYKVALLVGLNFR